MPWLHARTVVAWLDAINGTGAHERSMRLLKVTEEAGEAAQAYLGWQGQNPRKGTTHTRGQVATELCDVILAAMVALHDFHDDPAALLTHIAAARQERLAALIDGADDTRRHCPAPIEWIDCPTGGWWPHDDGHDAVPNPANS
nr:MazG-like family protein [Streptomyces hiroshimensis]